VPAWFPELVIEMNLQTWLRSNAEYSRKLVHSAAEGAHLGEEAFLHGDRLTPFLSVAAREAMRPAAIGAFVGLLSCLSQNRHRPIRAFAYGVLGGAIGFGAGLAWESRPLTTSVLNGARKEMGKVRDERWFEKNPIDYA
jgi:hypothetical protein